MVRVLTFMDLMIVLVTADSLAMEKTVLISTNVKLKIHVELMVFAKTPKDPLAVVATKVMQELVVHVVTSMNARSVTINVQSMLSVSILTVHMTVNASPASPVLDTHVSMLTNVRLVTMNVTKMATAKIQMAVIHVPVLMVSWVTA